jgi:hypothetical protein
MKKRTGGKDKKDGMKSDRYRGEEVEREKGADIRGSDVYAV